MRIRVLADRLVDDPVMVAASLRLGTTTVRDDHPGWLSIGCAFYDLATSATATLALWRLTGRRNPNMTTEKAVLAGGCFWGMQDMFRRLRGVASTRVGYTGGDIANPSYGNHQGARRSNRDRLRSRGRKLPGRPRALLPGPRPDNLRAAGERLRAELPFCHLLHGRTAVGDGTHDDCRNRSLWFVARSGGD